MMDLIQCACNDFGERFDFYIADRVGDEKYQVTIELHRNAKPIDQFAMFPAPSGTTDKQTAQRLFQAMWDAGLRPHNGEASSAHVNALTNHLEDMRKLVFKD